MNPALMQIVNRSETGVGHALVSPSFHTDPSFLSDDARESARSFDSRFLKHARHPDLDALEIPENGATDKVHFRVGGRVSGENGKVDPSSIFMVKPYYENLGDWQYGHYPLSGWAEMAWHGLLNASNLGHLAMRVHTFPYGDTSLLGVELEPGMTPTGWADQGGLPWNPQTSFGSVEFPEHLKDDASRLAAMDFLLNNQDRNNSNLLMSVNHQGRAHGLLAIDNGRSMQYMEAHRNSKYDNVDNLLTYLKSPAYKPLLGKSLYSPLSAITSWWDQEKPKVTAEFYRQLHGIQHYALASHMADSFDSRVEALDSLTGDFKIHGAKPYEDYYSGNRNGQVASLYHRASVKVKKWDPPHDPMPMEIEKEQPRHSMSCPTCGDDWDMGEDPHGSR